MDQRETHTTQHGTDHHDEAPAPRAIAVGAAMFLPAVIVLVIALVIIFVFVV